MSKRIKLPRNTIVVDAILHRKGGPHKKRKYKRKSKKKEIQESSE